MLKGTHLSEASKKKISETCKKRGVGKWMLGRKPTEETKKKLRQNSARYWLGKKRGKQSKETIEKRMKKIRGKKNPSASKRFTENNPCKGKFGKAHPNWKEIKKRPLYKAIREYYKYKRWRFRVFEKDTFTCQYCKKCGGDLEAHHIKPFLKIIIENNIKTLADACHCRELWDIENGITVCIPCHKKIDNHRR